MMVKRVKEEEPEWSNMFCPRLTLHNHKLRKWRTWEGSFPNDDSKNEAFIDPFENLDVMNLFSYPDSPGLLFPNMFFSPLGREP